MSSEDRITLEPDAVIEAFNKDIERRVLLTNLQLALE